jgi:DNA-binding cell septation regulator SpoVG
MVTNAGTKKMFLKGVVNGFGEAWYDPDQVANIFGFAKLEDQCRITYDSTIENAFYVQTDDGIVKLKCNKHGLYVYWPSKTYLKESASDIKHEGNESKRGEIFL